MRDLAIRTESLTCEFGALRAVNQLTLEVPTGIVFGFLGPNGAGKTTTIRLLLGLLEPQAGRAEVLGCDTRTQADTIRRSTGALLEHAGLYERLSAEDNLDFFGRLWHWSAAERRARINDLLASVGLWERRRELVGTWSRGMKQKLAVARALFHRPALVFLDEPTAGLDPQSAVALREDLSALTAREGVTVFLTTHNMAEAEKLCQQVGVIRQGKLIAAGHPDVLRARQSSPQLQITARGVNENVLTLLKSRADVKYAEIKNGHLLIDLAGEVDSAPLVNALVNAGVEVEEVRKNKASLEAVFLTLMEEET